MLERERAGLNCMNFNECLKRGFFNFADDSNDYNSYLAYCCNVGRVAIVLVDCDPGGVLLVSTMPLSHDWLKAFLNELDLLAREHGALDGTKMDQLPIIGFETIEAAERFAFVLVDWLKDCESFENPPRCISSRTVSAALQRQG
jgi:hypothetical protein